MVDQQVDFDTIAADLFTGLAELNLPPRAESALTLLQQPAAEGMRSLVQAQTAYTLLNLVGFVLPWLSLLLITAGVLTAEVEAGTAGQGEVIAAEAVPAGAVVAEVAAEPVVADVTADRPGAPRPEPGRSDTD